MNLHQTGSILCSRACRTLSSIINEPWSFSWLLALPIEHVSRWLLILRENVFYHTVSRAFTKYLVPSECIDLKIIQYVGARSSVFPAPSLDTRPARNACPKVKMPGSRILDRRGAFRSNDFSTTLE